MKTFIFIIITLGIVFFFAPILPPLNQGCNVSLLVAGSEPCTFHKETGYEYFITNKGTIKELIYSYKYDQGNY